MHKRTRRGVGVLVVFAVLLYGAEAHLNQIHYEAVSLENVVRQSGLIVIAKRADPATVEEEISITPKGAAPDAQKYPPYRRSRTRWTVQEKLHGDADVVGKTIEVDRANYASELDLHRRYYVEGLMKSPLYERYEPGDAARTADTLILFLSGSSGGYRFVVQSGFEVPQKKAKVLDLLKQRRSSPTVEPAD